MKLHIDRKKETLVTLEIEATEQELKKVKDKVLKTLAPRVKVAGFRAGKAPSEVIEKNIDQQMLQEEFVNEAINMLYVAALKEETLRPVGQPKVSVTKFVPFTVLEFSMEIPVVGEIKLPDYKKVTAKKKAVKVTDKEVSEVLENLQTRGAEKIEVDRAAKNDDEAIIDFKGVDKKGEPIAGADGTDYPLVLGSGAFIPGFEDNVVGMKVGESKTFEVTFPKEYGVKKLQNAPVTFTVTIKKIHEMQKPKLDDAFASLVGPFKSLDELKADIKKQIAYEAEVRAERDYEAALVNELADKTEVAIPEMLISEQADMVLSEVRQNALQRGLTFAEFLSSIDKTEETYREKEVLPEAERRVRAGLMLSEIADKEGIDVDPQDLEARIIQLKAQYTDQKMHEELDKPENRREINARLRTEKVIAFLKK